MLITSVIPASSANSFKLDIVASIALRRMSDVKILASGSGS